MKYSFKTKGTCAREITFELDGKYVHNVEFFGGCNGNLKAISKLSEGQDAEHLILLLNGNRCGTKNTSCADQFAVALREALSSEKKIS